MKTRALLLTLAMYSFFPYDARADHEIGFVEKFALAEDRGAVLKELIAGTEDYYFFHALHYQNTGKKAELAAILTQWAARNEHSPLLTQIRHREAMINYETDPQATLKYLRETLHVEFNHAQQTLNPKPDLPTALDPKEIEMALYIKQALRDPNQLLGLTPEGIEYLLLNKVALNPVQRRLLLQQVKRPDAAGLVPLILDDLKTKESRGFGEFPIHGQLLVAQLAELAKARPELMTSGSFVQTWLGKLRPSADVNLETNTAAREAWLDAAYAFVKDLNPGFNTLKAQILFERLKHDQKLGKLNAERFLAYLKLPRNVGYVSPKYRENNELFRHAVDLNNDPSAALGSRPIGNDEPVVRAYLLHFLATVDKSYETYKPYVEEGYLNALLAEAKLTTAQGDPEKWFSLISPTAVQALRERVDLEFAATNPDHFLPDQEVSLDLFVKNVPKLSASIFEINTLNYYRSTQAQIGTDLNLDGLIANVQQAVDYAEAPIQRVPRNFKFPQLAGKRGVWMVDFIGNGKSSRALIRKGQLHYVTRPSSAGTALIILDEAQQPMPKATALVGAQEFKADDHGEILLPFSNQPGPQPVILTDGDGFAQLEQIALVGENYGLTAGFHVPHESLISGRQVQLAIRPTLTVNGSPTDLSLLEEVKLTIVSTNIDGVNATVAEPNFKLTMDREATFTFTVPERLAQLNYALEAKVKCLLTGEKMNLSANGSQAINGLDKSDHTSDLYFSRMGNNYFVQCLGRTGEPRAEQACTVKFYRREFTENATRSLKTDAAGSIALGDLAGISSVEVTNPQGMSRTWVLPQDQFSTPENLHMAVGETLSLPWMEGVDKPDPSLVSLLETRRGTFVRDVLSDKTASIKHDYLILQNLEPGDYSLHYGKPAKAVTIRVTEGKPAGSFLLGEARTLERSGYRGLQINGVQQGAESLTIQLGSNDPDARIHVLASRFLPDFNSFSPLGEAPGLEPMVGAPASLKSLFLSGRTLGEEYRYVLDRRTMKKYPGSLLPRPGLLLNPWAVQDTETAMDEAAQGEEFRRQADGGVATASRMVRKSVADPTQKLEKKAANPSGPSSMNFLSQPGATLWNLTPDKNGVVTVKLADLKDRQFIRILAVDRDSAVLRDISLAEAGTKLRDLTLRNGLDAKGHFTRQNEVTILEKDAPFVIKDAATAQFEVQGDLGAVFNLFRTLSKNNTLSEFAFVLDWPTLDAAKKQELFSQYACHELSFFIARKDPEFFKSVVLPYYANKRDKTFLDDYLLAKPMEGYLPAWNYGRLNVVERILLGQRLPEQAAVTARDIRDLWHTQPVNVGQLALLFDTALGDSSLRSDRMESMLQLGTTVDRETLADMPALAEKKMAAPATAAPMNAPAPMAPAPAAAMAGRSSGGARGANRALKEKEADDDAVAASDFAMDSFATDSKGVALGLEGRAKLALVDKLARNAPAKQEFYRKQPPTKEWAENNYYHLRIHEQLAALVDANAFWADYAVWDGKGGFLSTNVSAAAGNFTEMMFALSVLDLPFPKDAKAPKSEVKDLSLTLTPTHRVLLFHREIKPAEIDKEAPKLLVSQNFYRNGDRYTQNGNEKTDKFVSEEFLTGIVYGCQVVVTNPTSSQQKLDLLVQIPQGAIAVLGSKPTDNVPLTLDAYRTHTQDYFFYFPKAGKYAHHPVHVSKSEKVVAFAEPFNFTVVNELTKLDTTSWDYVSQFAKADEVLAFMDKANLHLLDLDKIAWRCKDKAFFSKVIPLLSTRHVYAPTLWSYSIQHNDTAALSQWLLHQEAFLQTSVRVLNCKLVTLDPVKHYAYEHLEYSPLVNARAHLLGTNRVILNDHFLSQYRVFLDILAHQPKLGAEEQLAVTYYLLLQDRVEEALAWFATVDQTKVAEQLQLAYLQCVLAFYQEDTATARKIAAAHTKESVPRWRDKFNEVIAQLDEIDGKKPEGAKEDDREQRQNQLAAAEPTLDFTVENREIRLKYHNVKDVVVNYYPMDLEFLFSTAPFVSSDTSRFRMITPNKTERVVLPADKETHTLPLPKEFFSSNVLVEITSAGKTSAHAYYANELNVVLSEAQGRLQVLHAGDNRPLAKTYVKVFAEINGQPKFYKDGYTDLRGKFDYLSLSTQEMDKATKFGILIISEQHGAAVKEVKPPQQ